MKSNSKKCSGFGLIEVIISMAILGIISMSVYTGYILSIKHIKEGQVKQAAALEGKKVIEEIKSTTNIQIPSIADGSINIGEITAKEEGSSGVYKRYLNENYEDKNPDGTDVSEDSKKYTEIITITPTKVLDSTNNTSSGTVDINNNQQPENQDNDINFKVYISNEKISDTEVNQYISDDATNTTTLEQTKLGGNETIALFMDINAGIDNSRTITITDSTGKEVINKTVSVANNTQNLDKVNIIVNFDNYKQISSYSLKPVLINVYNKTNTNIPNIYFQKSSDLNANLKTFQGTINFYDNQTSDYRTSSIGKLYDIKVEINDDSDNLFTAYYKQNI